MSPKIIIGNRFLFLIIILISANSRSLAQTYSVPNAQIQPDYVFPVWFEDGNGDRDTVYFCYDADANNNDYGFGPDTVFGERLISIDTSRFNMFFYKNNTVALKVLVKSGLNGDHILPIHAKVPFTMSWDPNLFYDSTLLSIQLTPIPDILPHPLIEIEMYCGDYDPNFHNCQPALLPIYFVPEDPIGCCPNGFYIKTFTFYGTPFGPLSYLGTDFYLKFSPLHLPSGIPGISHNNSFYIYPNPTENSFRIKSSFDGVWDLRICDVEGNFLWTHEVRLDSEESFNVDFLSHGIYKLLFHNATQNFSLSLLKL